VTCPYCGNPAVFTNTTEIYGKNYGKIYLCRPCDAYVGVHAGSTRPKGSLANAELRKWRMKAHEAFDGIWLRGEPFNRNGAYQWLADTLQIARDECHIGMFGVEECKRVVSAVREFHRIRQGAFP